LLVRAVAVAATAICGEFTALMPCVHRRRWGRVC